MKIPLSPLTKFFFLKSDNVEMNLNYLVFSTLNGQVFVFSSKTPFLYIHKYPGKLYC